MLPLKTHQLIVLHFELAETRLVAKFRGDR
jgi:hypothetical protein